MEAKNSNLPAAQNAERELTVVEIETGRGTVRLTPSIVRRFLVHGYADKVTEQEIVYFLALCKAQNLNPFVREAYLIKYGQDASIVVGKETYMKRAFRARSFRGFKAGIIVQLPEADTDGKRFLYEEGTFIPPGSVLVGGWSEVFVDGWDWPLKIAVGLSEYLGKKSDGTINRQWATKPATMIRKVALVQGLREAFPEDMGGMLSEEEVAIDNDLPTAQVDTSSLIDVGEQPPSPAGNGNVGTSRTATSAEGDEQAGNFPKRMRKHYFDVSPETFGTSKLSTCGVTPATLLTIKRLTQESQDNAKLVAQFMSSRIGYKELSFLRLEEAEELLSQLAKPPVSGDAPPPAPESQEPPFDTGAAEEHERTASNHKSSGGPLSSVECPVHGKRMDVDSECLSGACSFRAKTGWCPTLGEKSPSGARF